jgi:hypothetical protein
MRALLAARMTILMFADADKSVGASGPPKPSAVEHFDSGRT